MKRFTIAIFSLTILAMFFIAGCAKTEIEPTPEEQPISGETGDETVDELSDDITNIDSLDDDLDNEDLANLEQDLANIDW